MSAAQAQAPGKDKDTMSLAMEHMDELGVTVEPTHDVPIQYVPANGGEILKQSTLTCRIIEDGYHTGNRIGLAELSMMPFAPGPPAHWHAMHDETFMVIKGTVRFHTRKDGKEFTIDAKPGDTVIVPQQALHTFSNPFNEPSSLFFTSTPASYIRYFKLLTRMMDEGKPMSTVMKVQAMARLATIPVKL